MKFWKSIVFVFLCSLFLVLIPKSVIAQNEFSVDAVVTYNVQTTGKTTIIHDITLENNYSTLYATTYTLGLESIDAVDVRAEDSNGTSLETVVQKEGDTTNIKITFPDAVTGKGSKRNFKVIYDNNVFAVKTGEIWEISIPRLDEKSSFRNYALTLKTPVSFGLEAYISPKPDSSEQVGEQYIYRFGKNDIYQTGITAGFGEFQVFTFNLSYHLENPLVKTSQTQISLPPDTAFQKVYIQSIVPAPSNVTVDADGNWIAVYELASRQRIDVVVAGTVQIFASYRPFKVPSSETLSENLKETEYWQVADPKIKSLASELKTPRAIYDYVSQNLTYNLDRVQPNVQRMGAVKALENPTQAICMEFTDLFVALSRAAGIPAREVNGYAYTENKELQPLGLVADVLHSWPEYYDKEKKVWIPVDPTWGSTTNGVDFFSKLDLRHFTFVNHGKSAVLPYPPGSYKLGPNPQKDVYVSFGKLPVERISVPKISMTPYRTLPFFSSIYKAKIANPGTAALYSIYPIVLYDSKEKNRDYIEVLPPYGSTTIQITVPFSVLGKDTPNVVEVAVGTSNGKITTNKNQVVVGSLLIKMVVIVTILIRRKKEKIARFFAKIAEFVKNKYAKIFRKSQKDSPPV